ncbi:MAG TPA: radical SAM protein [Candidatus Sumerlaeota bacterium]|nr:radical SAM protein [Candidatus Sumerlaeota bacterium]HPR99986.1 radical SAM protein [Candidatus Sumerlaeota bacterium]
MDLLPPLRNLRRKPRFDVLTLFVTNRCNARCATCFYWRELNAPIDNLTLEEYRTIATSMPPFEKLLLSGGEPTLEPNLPDLVDLFLTRPEQALVLPTNGLQTALVLERTREILRRRPQNRLVVGVSLDGLETTHDQIRGVPGAYRKALGTLHELARLREEYPLLQVTTLTTVMEQNENEILALLETLHTLGQADYYTVEPLRNVHPSAELNPPHLEALHRIQDRCNVLSFETLQKRHAHDAPLMLSHIRALQREQRHVLQGKRLRFPCLAGSVVGVLEPNGDVRLCELLDPIGNIRDFDCDFNRIWNCAKAQEQRRYIASLDCSCTHCVNLGQSLPFSLFPELLRAWDQSRIEKTGKIS